MSDSTKVMKRQKTDDCVDDLFAEEFVAPKVAAPLASNGGADAALDVTLQIPDGYALAYNPGTTNTFKVQILSASAKYNANGPTSVKLACRLLNAKNAGGDVIRAGPVLSIALSKNDKVKDVSGIDVNARLIPTGTTPVMQKSTDIFSLTVTLGRITQKGLKEAAVAKLNSGAEVELIDVYFNTSGMGVPWLTCTEFKVVKACSRLDGATAAVSGIASCGTSLVVGAALNSSAFRRDSAPKAGAKQSFDAVKELVSTTKKDLGAKLSETYSVYSLPLETLKLEDSEAQLPPSLLFRKTKIASPGAPTKGVLFNDAKLALYYTRTENDEKLENLFAGGAIVASDFGATLGQTNHKVFGELYAISTIQTYIPSIAVLKSDSPFALSNMLAIGGGIIIKVPPAVIAAPFGVNERATADLLMNNVLPVATMAFLPSKAKIYQRDYDKDDYAQDLVIDNSSQFIIDIQDTFRNVALRLSPSTVTDLFNGASHSTFEPVSGESLIDMMGGDHKPTVSTLTNGGVASLREQTVTLNDNTLEFYAIVNNAIKVASSDGNMQCGTNETVGNAAFLEAGGGTIEGCTTMLKKRELAVFAVRVKTKTNAASSTSAAE